MTAMDTDRRAEDFAIDTAFAESGLDPHRMAAWPKPGPPTPLRSYRGDGVVLTVAVTQEGNDRILVEIEGRAWAQRHGIAVPTVRDRHPTGHWFVADLVETAQPRGAAYVNAALDVADRISQLEPPQLPVMAATWRGERRTLLVRLARAVPAGLPMRQFLGSRRAAAALTDSACSHGDFYPRNVLAAPDGVVLVDFEYVGSAPRYTDHLRLWSTLRDPADREAVWQRLLAGGPHHREHIETLARWLALRLLAENLSAPAPQRDPEDLAHARRLVAAMGS